MSMNKIIPDRVDFRLRLPAELDRALRRRAARQWMDRNTCVRELIGQNMSRPDIDEARVDKLRKHGPGRRGQ
jgi:hypothetical protein